MLPKRQAQESSRVLPCQGGWVEVLTPELRVVETLDVAAADLATWLWNLWILGVTPQKGLENMHLLKYVPLRFIHTNSLLYYSWGKGARGTPAWGNLAIYLAREFPQEESSFYHPSLSASATFVDPTYRARFPKGRVVLREARPSSLTHFQGA